MNTNMIESAIELAAKAHRNQVRKGTDIPYITHPYAVGLLLTKAGCPEEVITAGILHDTIEDTSVTLDDIRENFGPKVANLVQGASEPDKSLSWEERKSHTIEFLKTAPLEVRLVACADKLHNIRTISAEYAQQGEQVWERFKRGKAKQEVYYRGLVESLCHRSDNGAYESLFEQLERAVKELFEKT